MSRNVIEKKRSRILEQLAALRIIEVRIPGDINGDGSVNVLDAIQFGNHFGLQQGDAGWGPDADMNRDGKVNVLDMILVGQCFGKSGSP